MNDDINLITIEILKEKLIIKYNRMKGEINDGVF